MKDFKRGILRGLPIGLGYIPVSFAFGLMVVTNELPAWFAVLMSLTNLTSAGQFAGTQLVIAKVALFEIAAAIFIINIRYMLMSLSLTQKLKPGVTTFQRLIFGFGVTDETFAMASCEPGLLSAKFMYGLITMPILGWTLGTTLGVLFTSIMSEALAAAMEVALYAMFIAIIIPPAKKERALVFCIGLAVAITCAFKYIGFFSFISDGFKIILTSVITACVCAAVFPHGDGGEPQ